MEVYPDWNFRENIAIHPCECNKKCGNYVLYVKGCMAHVRNAPEQELIDIASLDQSDLYDLFANIDEVLSVEYKRDELEKSLNKKIKNPKKINKKKEEN